MIEKLFVKKLFGIFDNEINFRDGGITVLLVKMAVERPQCCIF